MNIPNRNIYISQGIQTVGGFRSIFEKYNELFHCNDVFFHAGCETDKRQKIQAVFKETSSVFNIPKTPEWTPSCD
jgi:hypothetical protein